MEKRNQNQTWQIKMIERDMVDDLYLVIFTRICPSATLVISSHTKDSENYRLDFSINYIYIYICMRN